MPRAAAPPPRRGRAARAPPRLGTVLALQLLQREPVVSWGRCPRRGGGVASPGAASAEPTLIPKLQVAVADFPDLLWSRV